MAGMGEKFEMGYKEYAKLVRNVLIELNRCESGGGSPNISNFR